ELVRGFAWANNDAVNLGVLLGGGDCGSGIACLE
ncbi:MAG: hypothetical protein UZ07_CHB004003031, partial [Chlorobi bacterium OLB7]